MRSLITVDMPGLRLACMLNAKPRHDGRRGQKCQQKRAAASREPRTARKGFDAQVFFKDAFGISQAEQPWKVRLLFAREVATYIRERVWHASQELRQRRDGTLELRLQTSSRKELSRWILSWMPHVRVLAPRQLRKRVRQRMRQGLAHFS